VSLDKVSDSLDYVGSYEDDRRRDEGSVELEVL
jgi:hypothetical protein